MACRFRPLLAAADIMRLMEDIFYSGTFGGETLSLAAAIATIDKIEREEVTDRLWATGGELMTQAMARIAAVGLVRSSSVWSGLHRGQYLLSKTIASIEGSDQDIVPARDDSRRRSHQRKPQCLFRSRCRRYCSGAACL